MKCFDCIIQKLNSTIFKLLLLKKFKLKKKALNKFLNEISNETLENCENA